MKFVLLTLLLNTAVTLAEEVAKPYGPFQGCGEYLLAGVVRTSKEGLFIIVNEKTKSEYTFKSPTREEPKLIPYVDRPMKAKVVITKRVNGTIGALDIVQTVENRIPNPLYPVFDTGFRRIKKLECNK